MEATPTVHNRTFLHKLRAEQPGFPPSILRTAPPPNSGFRPALASLPPVLTRTYAEIARLEEARLSRSIADLAREAEPVAGGWMSYDAPGSWANQATGLGMAGPVTGADLDRLVAFYEARECVPRLEVCPFADPSLLQELRLRGFGLVEFENLLARDLAPGLDRGPVDDELTIEPVDPADERTVETFIDVSTSGFRPPDQPIDGWFAAITRRMVSHPQVRCFLARVGGEPAGGGACEIADEIVALFGTSVLPAFRRRGIQRDLMVRRLDAGRRDGARLAVIGSKPGIPTERNAGRLGFELAYTKVAVERRPPDRPVPGRHRATTGPA